ncbi:N-acetylglucosamine-6-phosphate deacetylase [Paenibacillus nasutitermitis]|uniref:N-acetylglucosamine-6-phosphate deacetylase n=1 Tax=Paenibacillus nasutitermitis TaxID=1652958 RepID=A0A916ZAG2_9BACL|nr:amidohydrolase family protein [Paenibacillus nasutitermitis]GGD82946.1 N-acetylglucosamine-6-phosphate deacetylase [Paenibacillus nasutitermitis]
MMICKGIRADTGVAVEISVDAGVLQGITPLADLNSGTGKLPWISPGWLDLQVNGYGGYDFNAEEISFADIEGASRALHSRGVALYLPTVITGSKERMLQGLGAISSYCRSHQHAWGSIAGIHLEGPYLSGEDGCRGAHPKEQMRDPDWAEFQAFQEAADGMISLVTLAPEREGSEAFIRRLVEAGIAVAIGHTKATAVQLDRAARAGASISTHLGNGSEPLLARHPNYIWDQLADDRLWATFIPDGHHLAPSVLKSMLRAKQSKAVLVSDCVKFGGMPPGRYDSLIGGQVELHADGRLNTAANPAILAGSAYSLDLGISSVLRYTDWLLPEAVEAVTSRPAQALGRPELGKLEPGSPANLTLFEYNEVTHQITIQETIVAGESVFRQT